MFRMVYIDRSYNMIIHEVCSGGVCGRPPLWYTPCAPYPVLTHRGGVSHGLGFEGVGQQHEFVYSVFRIHYFLYSINSINYKLTYYDLLNYCSRCAFHIFVLGARPLGAFLVDVSGS